MKTKIAGMLFASIASLAVCNPPNSPDGGTDGGPPIPPNVLDAASTVTNDICYFIEGIDTSGVSRTVCAVISEIIAGIGFIETLRTASDAGPPAMATCKNLPQTTYCATSAETAKMIQFISNVRAARQRLAPAAH